jgi:hypothetical protein
MELLADRDPEDARKLLDPVLEHMMAAVRRYEGTVNQVMGDACLLRRPADAGERRLIKGPYGLVLRYNKRESFFIEGGIYVEIAARAQSSRVLAVL